MPLVRPPRCLFPRVQICVLQFSNDCREEIPLQAVNVKSLNAALSSAYRMNGGTNVSLAIQWAGKVLKDLPPSARRVVALLTDGRIDSQQARDARAMVSALADEQGRVEVHAFGVGRGVDRAELLRVIGGVGSVTADADVVASRYVGLCVLDESPW